MVGTINGSGGTGVSGQGRRRARQPVPRTRRVEFTLTGEEYAVVSSGGRAGGAGPAERTPPRRRWPPPRTAGPPATRNLSVRR